MRPLRTSDVAKALGIHPNTVRKHEEIGFLPKPTRAPNGYRQFTKRHVDQARLNIILQRCSWLGDTIHDTALDVIVHSAAGDFAAARTAAASLLAQISEERTRAEQAAELLAAWATGGAPDVGAPAGMNIKEAAAYLNVTADTLRNWDRNGLINVPRHPSSGYRVYGPAELRRLTVIRALRRARYNLMSILNMFRLLDAQPGIDPRAAIDSLPPGEEDIYYSTNRWLTKTREIEGLAREAQTLLEEMAARYAE